MPVAVASWLAVLSGAPSFKFIRAMQVTPTSIQDCWLLLLDRHADDRGSLTELYRESRYAPHNLVGPWQQINCSCSRQNTVRGIHAAPFAKLVSCVAGRVFDVAVDLRPASPTYRRWFGQELSPEKANQLYIPPNCGHAFMALEDNSVVVYAQTAQYQPHVERTIHWRDPAIDIAWPVADTYILSARDRDAPRLDPDRRE